MTDPVLRYPKEHRLQRGDTQWVLCLLVCIKADCRSWWRNLLPTQAVAMANPVSSRYPEGYRSQRGDLLVILSSCNLKILVDKLFAQFNRNDETRL